MQIAMSSYVARFYPGTMTSTGLGWGLGIGRIGAILGPFIGGLLIDMDLTLQQNFMAFALPSLLAAVWRHPENAMGGCRVQSVPQKAKNPPFGRVLLNRATGLGQPALRRVEQRFSAGPQGEAFGPNNRTQFDGESCP
ncbi:hypothetical protein [Serratia entomophila]|nr:hypothetical protein [Serratia entomophila]UIW18649.1 hypothetical protein KHA73_01410 [Serratia entomophila]